MKIIFKNFSFAITVTKKSGYEVAIFLSLFFAGCYFSPSAAQAGSGFIAITQGESLKARRIIGDEEFSRYVGGNYVSMSSMGDGKFVVANYRDLFIFDRKHATFCVVSIIDGSGSANEKPKHNPTGVFFSENEKLYVANYKRNNILSGAVDLENCSFTIEAEYSSGNSLGPENVWVDQASSLVLSANYDAGTVTAFDIDTKKETWSAIVPQAHGVSVNNGHVYATGLTDRKIYKINILDGSIVKEKGGLGWNPIRSEFLWPTSIYPMSDHRMILSDAHTGFVSIIDADSLDTVQYMGGNGPSYSLFNYPYAAIPFGNEIAIMQSMRREILFISASDFSVTERFYFGGEEIRWPAQSSLPVFGGSWEGYRDFSGNDIHVLGEAWRLGFGNVHAVKDGRVLRIPDTGTLFNPNEYIYFLQGYGRENISILFSSSAQSLLGIVKARNGIDLLIPKTINPDSWLVGGRIVSGRDTNIAIEDILSEFLQISEKYHERMLLRGWLDKADLYEIFMFQSMGLDYENFLAKLDNVFNSPEGRRFQLAYEGCSNSVTCNIQELKKAARRYFHEKGRARYENLDEYLLIGMLTGVSATDTIDHAVEYGDCGTGSYYPGFGLNALYSDTLDDYLSAVDMEGSVVCLSLKDRPLTSGLEITWNDLETASKAIEIYGRKTAGEGTWELIGRFSDYPLHVINGYAKSSLRFEQPERYDEFYIAVTDGGQQQRLLIRAIQPVFIFE